MNPQAIEIAPPDFLDVTETAGDEVSREQVERCARRYAWALPFCEGKDVLEVACGTGPGLGLLLSRAKSVRAGDISNAMVSRVRSHYGDRVNVAEMDAQALPFPAESLDVIIIFEALYYVPRPSRFSSEALRVLRPGGVVLISNANKDLFDFNPSPYSHEYHGVADFANLFPHNHFRLSFWGDTTIDTLSSRQKLLRPIKKAVISLGVMPRTMAGKKFIKRLVFGELVPFPAELQADAIRASDLTPLCPGIPDRRHKVILCAARKI